VSGGQGKTTTKPNPATLAEENQMWFPNNTWNQICELSSVSNNFSELDVSFESKTYVWKTVAQSNNPSSEPFPAPFDQLDLFHKLFIIKILRPDKLIPKLKVFLLLILPQELIQEQVGEKYIFSPIFDITKMYKESKNTTPLFFILSPGADPLMIIENLAKKEGKSWGEQVKSLSLGRGQEQNAENSITNGVSNNIWIILQNCHLAKSFMNRIEKIIEAIPFDELSSFRLFLTALPTKDIPISIIQNSIKMTNEPPKGMKQSILRNYADIDEKFFESCKKPVVFKRLLYGFCFFHALIIERKKFGALGWNSANYQFSASDFSISRFQLKNFLDDYPDVQWEALNYMIAQANYGGRVTDPNDRILIKVIFKDICDKAIENNNYKFSGVKDYGLPPDAKYEDHLEFINNLSTADPTSIFGMHENADITCAINETNNVFNNILLTLPRVSGGGSKNL